MHYYHKLIDVDLDYIHYYSSVLVAKIDEINPAISATKKKQ